MNFTIETLRVTYTTFILTYLTPLLIFAALAVLFGCVSFYFRLNTMEHQVIKLFRKYGHLGYNEMQYVETDTPKKKMYVLKSENEQKKVWINHLGRITED